MSEWPQILSKTRRRALLLAVSGAVICSFAGAAVKEEPVSAFRNDLQAARQVVAACTANASGCNEVVVPADARISGAGSQPSFNANWQWLRDAVSSAKKQTAQKRAETMRDAEDRLAELDSQTAGSWPQGEPGLDSANFRRAKQTALAVLARGEFQQAEGPSWLDRQFAKIEDWIGRVFLGMANVGARNPWIAPLIEWICFGLAAGGLLFFVRRNLARQSVRIALSESAAARRGDRDATDWARLAQEHASSGDWRDAVHCLYWAGIVSLEARQAWRPNPTRTPREYLRLLRPGSDAHRLLRELTVRFERAWYGHGDMDEAQYRAALASFEALRTAELKRNSADGATFGERGAAAGVA